MALDKQQKSKRRGRWKPGESGNPRGRPAKPQCARELLDSISREAFAPGGGTRLEALLRLLYDMALNGEPWAVRELLNRLLGRPLQPVQMSGPEGGPIIGRLLEMTPEEREAELKTLLERRRGE